MAGLPEGWESDYDGSRWFYRYKPTGQTQYRFPNPGDEFPEFVGLGFGPLALAPEERLASEQQVKRRTSDGSNNAGSASRANNGRGSKATPVEEEYAMSATGYFDPESFMYSGLGNVSPIIGGRDDNTDPTPEGTISPREVPVTGIPAQQPIAFELHEETRQVKSPVGFVAELASSDTVKCAEELAPIELDATSFMPEPIQTDITQYGPAELPTHRSSVDPQPISKPTTSQLQPTDAYPLVSASFAYPPLKTTGDPTHNMAPAHVNPEEPKVLASERPPSDNAGQNKYQPWTPAQRIASQESQLPNRNSMVLSQVSILQTQDSELGGLGKRHSLSGPIGGQTTNSDIPEALRLQMKTKVSTPPDSLKSPILAVLQPAVPPSTLPGSGARYESISSGSGKPDSNHQGSQPGLTYFPSVLKPGARQQQASSPGNKTPEGTGPLPSSHPAGPNHQAHGVHTNNNRVNTLPNKLPSQDTSNGPPRMNGGGPGFLFFHEIPTSNDSQASEEGSTTSNTQDPTSRIHGTNQIPGEPPHFVMNDPLPVIAPLALFKPSSPNKPSTTATTQSSVSSLETFDQISEVISVVHSSISQTAQDRPPGSIGVVSQSSAQNLGHSGSTGVIPGTGKPPTGIPNANTQHMVGQHQHVQQQATMNQITSAGMTSLSSQNQNKPNPTTPSSASNPILGPQILPSSHALPGQPSGSSHRPSFHQPLQSSPSTLLSGPQQGPKPTNHQIFAINTGSSGQPLDTPGLSGHLGPQMKPSEAQSSPGQPTPMASPPQAMRYQQKPPITPSQTQQPGIRPNAANNQPHGSTQGHMSGKPNVSPATPVAGSTNSLAQTSQTNHQQVVQPLAALTTNQAYNTFSPPYKPNGQAPIHGGMGHPGFSHALHRPQQSNHIPGQSMGSHSQATMQGPPSNLPSTVMSPSQLAFGSKPTQQSIPHGQNQISPQGTNIGQAQSQHSSPTVHYISPSQSQVSSPTPSIASLHRPPSSAPSPISMSATITSVPSNSFTPNTNQQPPNQSKPPTVTQQPTYVTHNRPQNLQQPPPQGIVQTPQQPNLLPAAPMNPFPMLPGQVKPLPSQVGTAPNPAPARPQPLNGQAKPPANTNQTQPRPQIQQVAPQRPPQQPTLGQPIQMQYMPGLGQPAPGQAQPSHMPPQMQARPPHQQIPPHAQVTGQPRPQVVSQPPPPSVISQATSSVSQPTGHNQAYAPQMLQPQPLASTPAGIQMSFAPPPIAQVQQPTQTTGGQSSVQLNLQGKPFNSTQATAALTGAGKGVKKWAKKMWQNPTVMQTTAAVGGAIIAESIGGDGVAGAALANRIYNTSQPRPQMAGPQRPPGPPHAQTAPPQAQGIPGPIPQHYQAAQAVNRPQMGMQPIGVQTPGRPVAVQNQTMVGATLNVNGPQQVGGMQQCPPQPVQGPLVGRPQSLPPPPPPPLPQMMIQQRPPPPPFPAQPNQAQDSVDPNMVAIATIGGAAIGAAIRANNQQESSSHPGSRPEQHYAPPPSEQHAEHYASHSESYAPAHENTASDSYYAEAAYTTTDTTAVADNTMYADSTSMYMDASSTYTDTTAYADTSMYADTSATYMDSSSYAVDAAYADTSYVNVDVDVDVNVNMSMNETVFSEDGVSMVSMEESVSVSTDYSGGDWGEGW